jgi:hypothetical protein
MSRSDLSHLTVFSPFLFGYRDPLPQHGASLMGAESEIPQEPDPAAGSDRWSDGAKGGRAEDELDPRIPKIMEDVRRYIRGIDVNTL